MSVFQFCYAQNPSVEVRAVWLTTMWNLDWPSPNLNIEGQKQQLIKILDQLKGANINTVFFQARLRGDVFYNSKIEPLSNHAKRGFDPLAFAIEECHKRGIECHAWFVTFPLGNKKQVDAHGRNSIVKKRPDLCKFFNGEWYLDPGNPDTRKYLLSLVDEIVRNYDIDGIHFDYIRYPDKAAKFPDGESFRRFGRGMRLDDWRRSNINQLVSEIYDNVKVLKPWVQVSSSPLGKYKELGYGQNGWTAYGSVYQDTGYWMKSGKHDAVYPMMYYKEELFYPYLEDWIRNSNYRMIVPGLGAYRLLPQEKNWGLKDITDQIDFSREKKVAGQAYFRAGNVLNNLKGIETTLKQQYYRYPAKLPAMTWLDNVAPNSPVDLEVFLNNNGQLCIRWQPDTNNEQQTYTIYCSHKEDIDINNPENILATGVRGNQVLLNMQYGEYGFYYAVSASDRFHNESVACFPAFFVHSRLQK